MNSSGIVLFAKQTGKTSFSSLYTIKHALQTTKVGHTGTLDSFACGLLVVCTGSLTRLASRITAFNKKYQAVVKFGQETDTLDPTGNVIKTAPLPTVQQVKDAILSFTGNLMQVPPTFSAIHVNGKRSSDLARNGKSSEIPARPINVYSSKLIEIQLEDGTFLQSDQIDNFAEKKVLHARIEFFVSKGTYIRSLARDIGEYCSSAAYLIGLLRTEVGCFSLCDAAGIQFLSDFSIKSVLDSFNKNQLEENQKNENELLLQKEVIEKLREMDGRLADECGFLSVELLESFENAFYNGKMLKSSFFKENDFFSISDDKEIQAAVFTKNKRFAGIINKNSKKISYGYVVPRPVMQ